MATRPQISLVEAAASPKQRRIGRRPTHDFNLKTQPYQIQPFMIAPIRPGETLTNLLLQARVVTDPINNPLIGWWKEYYFFHVPWRGMPDFSAHLQAMALNAGTGESPQLSAYATATANSTALYTAKGTAAFVDECLEVVVEEFFRDEGEAVDASTLNGLPKAIVDQEKWFHSLKLAAQGADDVELPGVDELEDVEMLPGWSTYYAQWEMMRDMNVIDVTFEDYLRAQGVDIPQADVDTGVPQKDYKPELIRFVRDWTYPTNHVDPATGTPSSACSWSIAERADKRRFFKEPGFLFGVTVTRPKIYMGAFKGNASGELQDIRNWFPNIFADHPYLGLVETPFSATDGLLQNQTANYWFDMADLFTYGDQFINYAASVATGHAFDLPTAAMEKRYASTANITALFKTAGTEYIREDGRVALNILSTVRHTT